ncbi:hypothetical protein GCM10027271_24010 [Saccharopolyspora gloriosae]|uniref:Uncharacterized protein n=1 Tax=Saccharopolyspora gloriosae TaxID=455344 RepID=A0A840NP61_9PSEU|nr:hypothetical protein [Saccharopolyspora gloriosae]MBB5071069.1 hypothetical protein [Saccharopolyspora gloriosae]
MNLSADFIEGVREAGEDDWVQFIDLGHLLIEESGTNERLIERGVDAAAELIERGIVRPGQLTEHGFQPWTCSKSEAIDQIREMAQEISKTQSIFRPGDICWFDVITDES